MRMKFFSRGVPKDPAGRKFKAKFEFWSKRVAPRPSSLGLPERPVNSFPFCSAKLNLEGPFSREKEVIIDSEGLISFSFNLEIRLPPFSKRGCS